MSRSNSSPPERVREPCVIYARYSSHAQRDVSIEQQVADCEAYALQNGLEVVKVYADRAISGTNDKRPQFHQWGARRTRHHLFCWCGVRAVPAAP